MIDLALINKQLETLGLMSIEEFRALYNERFADDPVMQKALLEWQETYDPIRLQRTVRQRLLHLTVRPRQALPDDLNDLIAFFEDDVRRTAYLAELYKVRLTNRIEEWCYKYFLEVNL